MSYGVDWRRVPEHRPPENTFKALWVMTDEGIRMGHFNGEGDGSLWEHWKTGWMFGTATHWAYIIEPNIPNGTEDKTYMVKGSSSPILLCDRCKELSDRYFLADKYQPGNVVLWAELMNESEKVVCRDCMIADDRYRARYFVGRSND